jgi:putative intracellular protease/amidase
MTKKKILILVGDYVEDYEAMVPFQMLTMVGHKLTQFAQIRKLERVYEQPSMTLRELRPIAKSAVTISSSLRLSKKLIRKITMAW